MSIVSAGVLIFLVLDPLGNIPFFLAILQNVPPQRRRPIIIRELFIALIILVIFLFAGRYILVALNVEQASLGMAGGVILLFIAIRMIFSGSEKIFEMSDISEPFIVPLAIPAVAGPSAMATVILIMGKDPSSWYYWLLALFCAWFLSAVILYFSGILARILGRKGLLACERLMGMLLTAVAVEMFVTGLRQSFFITPA